MDGQVATLTANSQVYKYVVAVLLITYYAPTAVKSYVT